MLKKVVLIIVTLCPWLGALEPSEVESIDKAIYLQEKGDLQGSFKAYATLYEKTKKLMYWREQIIVGSEFLEPNVLLSLIEQYKSKNGEMDNEIKQILLQTYLLLNDEKSALKLATELYKNDEENTYLQIILGSIYTNQKNYKNAAKFLELALENVDDTRLLVDLIKIYNIQKQYDKISQRLDSYIEENGCKNDICSLAISFYEKGLNNSKIEGILERMYADEPNIANAQNLVQIYKIQGKYKEALDIVKKHPLNLNLQLDIYSLAKKYDEAAMVAKRLYEESKNAVYLAFSCLYKFETIKEDRAKVLELTQELQKAVIELEQDKILDALQNIDIFYNFLGYLMIDYDIDLVQGLDYVKKAIAIDGKNDAYLDSLAWGYFKTNQCKLAKKTLKKIKKNVVKENPEIQYHKEHISTCK